MNHSTGLRWIIRQSRPARFSLLLVALSSAAGSATSLMTTMILKAFTDYAAGESGVSLPFLALSSAATLVLSSVFLLLDALGTRLARYHTERSLRMQLMNSITRADWLDVQQFHTGELLTRLTKDTENVASCLPQLLHSLLGGCLSAAAALIYMLHLSWQLTLAILLVIPILMVLIRLFSPVLQNRTRAERLHEESARSRMQDILDSLPLFHVFRSQSFAIGQLQAIYRSKLRSVKALGVAEGCFQFLNTATGMLTFLLTMGLGACLTASGKLTIGGMIAIINLLHMVTWPLSNISSAVVQVKQAAVCAQRLEEVLILRTPPLPPLVSDASRLSISDLCFAYPSGTAAVKQANAIFQKGVISCICGASGCGKSTLLKLLLGLLKPCQGRIEPANIHASFVPSDHYLYSATVRENLLMGAPQDEQKLDECIHLSNAGFVHSLPQGLDTPVGNGGLALSSGQAQRIAIARAIYRDSKLLIMDEPTSNLDHHSAKVLQKTLHVLAEDRIVVVVTHDPELMRACDVIFRMEGGQLS